MAVRRLKKGSVTLKQLLESSYALYRSKEIDDKRKRVKLDLVSAKIRRRSNLEFNQSLKIWEQTNPYGVIFEFIVNSKPISYKRIDKLKKHTYPVFIHFLDFSLGMNSPVKLRTGTQFKWKKTPKGSSTKERQKIAERNIHNGVQADFIFGGNMFLYDLFGILYGRNSSNGKPPKIRNPKMLPYLDKTALFVITKIIIPMFRQTKSPLMNKLFK